jgi:hypothetical protein
MQSILRFGILLTLGSPIYGTNGPVLVPSVQQSSENISAHGRIKGVVTYYFNDNFGDKGDVGAEVFLVAGVVELPADTSEFKVSKDQISITSYLSSKEFKQNRDAEKNHLPVPHPVPQTILFPVIDSTVVDMNGNFQLDDVSIGSYTVVIRSSHSRGEYFKKRDVLGRVRCIATLVTANRTADVSYKFPATGSELHDK